MKIVNVLNVQYETISEKNTAFWNIFVGVSDIVGFMDTSGCTPNGFHAIAAGETRGDC